MTKKEIIGICAFAKALNCSWNEEKVFVSSNKDFVVVTGELEFVLNFVSSVTNLFCAVCASLDVSDDGSPVYRLF